MIRIKKHFVSANLRFDNKTIHNKKGTKRGRFNIKGRHITMQLPRLWCYMIQSIRN